MKFPLPIVATIKESGVAFIVRAVPFGLSRRCAAPGADTLALSVEIYDHCVEVENGEKPAIDDLPSELVGRLVKAACENAPETPSSPPPPKI